MLRIHCSHQNSSTINGTQKYSFSDNETKLRGCLLPPLVYPFSFFQL